MGLLTFLFGFTSDLAEFFYFVAGFWQAVPNVIRFLIYACFGGSLLVGIYRMIL